MSIYNITTAVNIDTLSAKAGSDTYNINGGYLTVDQHTRYGVNQNTSAAMGNITMSASLGGTIEFNSTLVRVIPYNSGTGNVPALDTAITRGSSTGKLLGVYSALTAAPTTAGSAMPASGYILIRQWNSVSYTAGALGGISATATAADRAGWLEIVGVESLTATVNRLNTFLVRGDYYDFFGATTDGNRATTYQLPTNGSTVVYVPGVEVETGTGTGIYEFYPRAGTITALAANIGTDAVRGKWSWISTSGVITFGNDGTNSTGGYVPPSGRKIRVPNIFFTVCTAAAPTVNVLPNITLTTRYEFLTSGGGVVDIDKACINWYLKFTQPFSIKLTNCSTFESIILTECASAIAWSNVGIGQTAANSQIALTMGLNFAGGTMDSCVLTRASQGGSGAYVATWTDCSGFTVTNQKMVSLVKAANATTGSATLIRVSNSSWNNTTLGGGRVLMTTCTDVSFTDSMYFDNIANTTSSTMPMYVWDVSTGSLRCTFDGLTFGELSLVQPYSGILNIGSAGCTDIKLRNLGTANTPLNMGGEFVANAAWSRATTTMTITKANHGLKVGDLIAYHITSDVTPNAVTTTTATLEAVVSVPTSSTFTITVTNAGGAAGTCSYFPTMTGTLLVLAAGAAANNVKVQRCYTPNLRTGVMSGDNSSNNIILESVWGTTWGVQLVPELNCYIRGLLSTPALTAQTSVYGTHFIDYYNTGVPENINAVAWTRSTTTATITSNNHNMRTGDTIAVHTTSDSSAIVKGVKTITATTSNTFTFTCLNAGGASGTLSFSPLNGRIAIQMNESTTDTVDQVTLSNGAAFTSAGSLYMPSVGHSVDFTSPINILGHSSFPITEIVMAGGTLTNHDILYSLNGGTTFRNLSYPRAGGGGSNGSTNVTMTSTTGVNVGDYVWGTNIAPNAKVQSITNGTTIVVDTANIGTVSGILRFNYLPNEVVSDPLLGFSLIVRVTTSTTNVAAITSLYIITTSTSTARTATYPLDTVPITVIAKDAADLSNIEGARVYLVADTGGPAVEGTIIINQITDSSGQVFDGKYEYVSNQPVIGKIRKGTSSTKYKTSPITGTITEDGLNITAFMVSDE